MAASLDRIFSEIAQFTKTMGNLHGDFLEIVQRDIQRFLEKTNDLQNQMNWQGWTTLSLTTLGASLAIVGAMIPKSPVGATTPTGPTNALDLRLNANAGLQDSFTQTMKWIGEKLNDNEFLRTTCKTTSKFFNGVSPAADTWFRSTTTEIEAKRGLLERINIQSGQSMKSTMDNQVSQAHQAALRLLDSKAKGG